MLQTTKEIQNEEEEKNREYLETSTQYYTEEVKSLNDIENEGKRNLLTETIGANKSMTVDDKITFEDWYVDNKFESDNIKT